MKKIINGAKYDTSTAKCIGRWRNTSDTRNFNYCEESLYRTKSGKYFLHGEGGAMSRYASHNADGWSGGGEEIVPMSRAAAMEWAEVRLDGDDYETAFGEVPEEEGEKEQLNVIVTPQLKQSLWGIAEEKKMSLSAVVEELLAKAMR